MQTAAQIQPATPVGFYDPLKDVRDKVNIQDGLDARAIRYGLLPIWDADGLKSSSTYVNFLPAGNILTFRPFQAQDTNPAETGGHSSLIEITPYQSVNDMETVYGEKGFRSFTDLAKLAETDAAKVIELLWRPLVCDKYPDELGSACATCRLRDLRHAQGRIDEVYAFSSDLYETAGKTLVQLTACLEAGLKQARLAFDLAVNLIRQPQSGKNYLDVPEIRAMYNLHETKPELQQVEAARNYGEMASAGLGREIAAGMKEGLQSMNGNSETTALLQQLLDQNSQVMAQNAQLIAENQEFKEKLAQLNIAGEKKK